MKRRSPFAFELRGLDNRRLNGIYRKNDDYLTENGGMAYKTYWNLESEESRPYLMYWQPHIGRHAVTPRYDDTRTMADGGPDVWPQVSKGTWEPGLAFYRPVADEWMEFCLHHQTWIVNKHVTYTSMDAADLVDRLMRQRSSAPASSTGSPAPMTPASDLLALGSGAVSISNRSVATSTPEGRAPSTSSGDPGPIRKPLPGLSTPVVPLPTARTPAPSALLPRTPGMPDRQRLPFTPEHEIKQETKQEVKDECIDLDAEAWGVGYESEPVPKRARKDPRSDN